MSFLRKIRNRDEREKAAKRVKDFLQMVIGIGLTILLIAKLALWLDWFRYFPLQWMGEHWLRTDKLATMGTLEVVAYALGYSAAVELAFMLFTEGPDEAVDPVIMGLAAAALSTMSAPKIDLNGVFSIILYVIALAGMFAIRRYLLVLKEGKPKSPAPGE